MHYDVPYLSSRRLMIVVVELLFLLSQAPLVVAQQQVPPPKNANEQAKAPKGGLSASQATPNVKTWQTDWATFVDEYRKCLQSSACPLGSFKDKTVAWHGVFKSIDAKKKSAKFDMTPNEPAFTDRNGRPGTFLCCNVSVVDVDVWKALAAGTEVTFTAILGKDYFDNLFMMERQGAVILGAGELVSQDKKP